MSQVSATRSTEPVGIAETPCPYDYPVGTKRPRLDTDYDETFNKPTVRLVNVRKTPITAITPTGVRIDAMTGSFTRVDIRGRGGVSLRDEWANGPMTYLGLAMAGFPNVFAVTGPQSRRRGFGAEPQPVTVACRGTLREEP